MTADQQTPHITDRPMRFDGDFWLVRNLLLETYLITPTGFNWEVRRWDGWRFYRADPAWNPEWGEIVRLWETKGGRIVGAVHPEGSGDAHIQIHPEYRHIENDIIAWAESNLSVPTEDSRARRLRIFAFDYDTPRRRLLQRRGYEKTSRGGVMRRLRFGNVKHPQSTMADGYEMRTIRADDDSDCQKVADILNAGFNRDFHNAAEFRGFATHAPCYRSDLDLVAVALDGSFAAYAGVLYNEPNLYGIFEPICTHPDHLRKGLSRTLMSEGLNRLDEIGAHDVYVLTGDQKAANELYDAIGFTEAYYGHEWQKTL